MDSTTTTTRQLTLPVRLMLGGAALLAVASFLPWAKATIDVEGERLTRTVGGIDGDGPVTLLAALSIGVVAGLHVSKGRRPRHLAVAVGAAALAVLTAAVDLVDVARIAGSDHATSGIGLWLSLPASLVALAGSILVVREHPPTG